MYIALPSITLDRKNSCAISPVYIPYPIEFYLNGHTEVRTLKVIAEEVAQLLRRYAMLYPNVVETVEHDRYTGYRCMAHDESTGITREILQRLGYTLEESKFSPYGLYWITLQTRMDKGRKK